MSVVRLETNLNESGPDPEQWDALLQQCGCTEPSVFPAYYDALRIQLRSTGCCLRVCYTTADSELQGVTIVVCGSTPVSFGIGQRILLSPRVRSIVVQGHHPAIANAAISRELLNRLLQEDRDVVIFERFEPGSSIWLEALDQPAVTSKYRRFEPYMKTETCAIAVTGTWEDFQKKLPAKVRHELRRKVGNMTTAFGPENLTLSCIRSEADVAAYHADVRIIGDDSWQRKRVGERSIDSVNPDMVKHLGTLAKIGMLRGYILRAGGKPVAFVFGLQYRQYFHLKDIGFSLQFKKHSPGQVLLYKVLEDLFLVDSPELCDLGYGNARFKRELCSIFKPVTMLWLVRKGSAADYLTHLDAVWKRAQRQAGDILARMKLKQRIITWLRQG